MKYTATITAVFEIEAENVIEAYRVSKRLRCIGEVSGSRHKPHNRDSVRYSMTKVSEQVKLARSKDKPLTAATKP